MIKIHRKFLKIFFSRNLVQIILWWR
jgi:hypothetical protein